MINSLEQGLAALQQATDFASLKQIITETLSVSNVYQAKVVKDRIARIMRAKQAAEAQAAAAYPQALDNIDRKYQELAKILKYTPVGVVTQPRIIPPSPGLNTEFTGAAAAQAISPPVAPATQPTNEQPAVKPAAPLQLSGGLGSLGALTVLNWVKSKKSLIMKGVGAGALLGGAYWMYNKVTNPIAKNPNTKADKESDFSRTIRSIEKYRAFSRMSKDPNFSGDYSAFLEGKIPPKTKKPISSGKDSNTPDHKLNQWEKDEQKLMNYMDSAHMALTERPKLEIPRLPFNSKTQENPIPIVSDEVDTTQHSEVKTDRAKKKKKNPEVPPVEVKVSSKPEPTGRLIPIIKRTKRIRKVV